MDGRNRQRFQGDPQLLAQWVSASTVLGKPRASEGTPEKPGDAGPGGMVPPPEAGDVRPAA
jgi:hypothetical protein